MIDDENRMRLIRRIVREQTFDEALWDRPQHASESYTQDALRLLHMIVKHVDISDFENRHWKGHDD